MKLRDNRLRMNDNTTNLASIMFKEYSIPSQGFFDSGYCEFKDGEVILTAKYQRFVNRMERFIRPYIDRYTVTKAWLSNGHTRSSYPEIHVEITYDSKTQHTTIGKTQYTSYCSDEGAIIVEWDQEVLIDRAVEWIVRNGYKQNIKNSKVVSSWIAKHMVDDKGKPKACTFTWISMLLNKLGLTKSPIIGSSQFKCTPETMAITNDKLVDKYIKWDMDRHQMEGFNVPAALLMYYFPSITRIIVDDETTEYEFNGSPHNANYCSHSPIGYYIENNLCDYDSNGMQFHSDKYRVMTEYFEQYVKNLVIENAGRFEITDYAVSIESWVSFSTATCNLSIYCPDKKYLGFDFKSTSNESAQNDNRYNARENKSNTLLLHLAKRVGVYDILIKGLEKIITNSMGNNILECMISKEAPCYMDLMQIPSFSIRDFIGDLLLQKEKV